MIVEIRLIAAEDVVHRALQWTELGVVDLDEDDAVVAHEIARRAQAIEHHGAPRQRIERVVVLDEAPARVERRVEVDAAEPAGEARAREAAHGVEVLGVNDGVGASGIAVRARRVAREAGGRADVGSLRSESADDGLGHRRRRYAHGGSGIRGSGPWAHGATAGRRASSSPRSRAPRGRS